MIGAERPASDASLARCETQPIREESPAFEVARVRGLASRWGSGPDGWSEHFFAPLVEAGGARGVRGARFGVVEALVLCCDHVDQALSDGLAHPVLHHVAL